VFLKRWSGYDYLESPRGRIITRRGNRFQAVTDAPPPPAPRFGVLLGLFGFALYCGVLASLHP
jgi:hypothetical protein